jgi:hypothetical protein
VRMYMMTPTITSARISHWAKVEPEPKVSFTGADAEDSRSPPPEAWARLTRPILRSKARVALPMELSEILRVAVEKAF